VNRKIQSPYKWKGHLQTDSSAIVVIGTYSLPIGLDTVKAWVYGTLDSLSANDTSAIIDTAYALPEAKAGKSRAICMGETVDIGPQPINGHSYSWKSKPAGHKYTKSFVTVIPYVTTIFYLTETVNATGCSKTDSVIITVNPVPSPDAGGNRTICKGESLILGPGSASGNTYYWTTKKDGLVSTDANPIVSPDITTMYYLTEVIPSSGCSKTDSALVSVMPLPVPDAGADDTICAGLGVTLGPGSSSSKSSYSWTSNPPGFTSSISNPIVKPGITTTYYLTETVKASGCSKMDSVVIKVIPSPFPNAGSDKTICSGQSIQLGKDSVDGHAYSWTSAPAGFTSNIFNPVVRPDKKTVYYLRETAKATGCSATDTVIINVNPLPAANAGSSQSICQGEEVSLGATPLNGHTYSWVSKPAGFSSNVSAPAVTPLVTTTYYLTETIKSSGCSKTDSVVITVHPRPEAGWSVASVIDRSYLFRVKDSSSLASAYSWDFGDGGAAFGYHAWHTFATDSTYRISLQITDQNSCSNSSDSLINTAASGIPVSSAPQKGLRFSVYPNPFKGQTQINYTLEQPGPVRIRVSDMLGRQTVLLDDRIAAGDHSFLYASKDKVPGIYFISCETDGQVITQKILQTK
jgi:hypothetical protein